MPDRSRWTPVEHAIAARDRAAVVELLGSLGDINARCDPEREDSVSPLFTALRADAPEVVAVVTANADFSLSSSTPEWDAFSWARTCSEETLATYLDLPGLAVNHQDGNGVALLHEVGHDSARPGKTHAVLAVAGVAVDLPRRDGATPLYDAAMAGNLIAVDALLEGGAEPATRQADSGWTPLVAAIQGGHEAVVVRLLGLPGVSVAAVDSWGATALHVAATRGQAPVVALLLEDPAVQVNARDDQGMTPLLRAVAAGHRDVVALLLGRDDVDRSLADQQGITPLRWARDLGADDIAGMIRASTLDRP